MLILDATTRSLEIDLNGAITTNQLPFVASYVDIAKTTQEVSSVATNAGASNSTTAVTLVAAPGANLVRKLSYLSVRNADTVATLLWIQLNDNSTLREIWKGTLAVGDTLVYVDSLGFNVLNSSGQIKTGSGLSSIGASTDNALVRWDGTGGTAIQNSGWTLDDSNVLTAGGNVSLGANYISRAGTAAGLSLDASNNATFSSQVIVQNSLQLTAAANNSSMLQGRAWIWTLDGLQGGTLRGGIYGTSGSSVIIGTGASLTTAATFDSSQNATLSGTLTVSGATITTGSTTALSLATSGGTQVSVINIASAVNYLEQRGAATGGQVGIAARGSDTNVGLSYDTQAAGSHTFTTGTLGATQVRITHTAAADRSITLTGSNGGNPTIGTSGGDLGCSSSLSITGYAVATTGFLANVTPSSTWAFDGARANALVTIADNATYDLAGGSGLIVVHNDTSGTVGLFLAAAGVVTEISDPNAVFSVTVDTPSSTNIYYNGSSAYRIQNKTGGSVNYYITTIRTRAST